jgi:hypothetical protein
VQNKLLLCPKPKEYHYRIASSLYWWLTVHCTAITAITAAEPEDGPHDRLTTTSPEKKRCCA